MSRIAPSQRADRDLRRVGRGEALARLREAPSSPVMRLVHRIHRV